MKRTEEIDRTKHMESVARQMKNAARRGEFDGFMSGRCLSYLQICTRVDQITGTKLLFTRDSNHHESGWFKNPDYERCLHLSLSPLAGSGHIIGLDGQPLVHYDLDKPTVAKWVLAFFHDDVRYVWAESPKSKIGKRVGVWHWRLFCDENWKPILPRGEVYSKEFTELGWRSASQVFEEDGIEILSPLEPG